MPAAGGDHRRGADAGPHVGRAAHHRALLRVAARRTGCRRAPCCAGNGGMRIDLHTHSLVSDGTDTPTQLVRKAAKAGLDVIGLTDHDTFDGLREAKLAAQDVGVEVLAGMEFSTEKDGVSVHVVAYGCDPHDEELLNELARVRVGRSDRVPGDGGAAHRAGHAAHGRRRARAGVRHLAGTPAHRRRDGRPGLCREPGRRLPALAARGRPRLRRPVLDRTHAGD